MGPVDDAALAGAGQDVGAQPGGDALDELAHVHREDLGAGVEEAEVQLLLTALVRPIFLLVHAHPLGHLRLADALDGAQLLDAGDDLLDLELQRVGLFHLISSCLRKKKRPRKTPGTT